MIEHGVRVQSPRGDFDRHPAATDDIDAMAEADVVFVGLKAYSLPELAPAIGAAPAAGRRGRARPERASPGGTSRGTAARSPGASLESVDPGGVISRSIAAERVVGCVVYCSTEIVEPGVIRHIEGTRFTIGEPDGRRRPSAAARSPRRSGRGRAEVPGRASSCARQIWLKLIGNAAFNPITTLTRATHGRAARLGACARATSRGRDGGVRGGRRRARGRAAGLDRPPARGGRSRSATTAPRCCRTSRRASRSSSTA